MDECLFPALQAGECVSDDCEMCGVYNLDACNVQVALTLSKVKIGPDQSWQQQKQLTWPSTTDLALTPHTDQ